MPRSPALHDPDTIRSRYDAETAELLRARLWPLILTFLLTFVGTWVVEIEAHAARSALYGACLAVAVALQVAAVWILHRHDASPRVCLGVALFVPLVVVSVTTVYELLAHGEVEVLALGHIFVLVCSMVFLPWGARGQLVIVAASLALYVVAISLGLHSVAPVGMLVIGLAAIGVLSVAGADRLERYRFSTFRQAAELAEMNNELTRANEALSEANRAKAQCLANVSHEFRTPLNAIIGFAQLAQEGTLGEVPVEAREALDRVLTNSWMLLGLVNDFLDFARLEANRLTLRMERVAVSPLCAEVADLVEPLLSGKPVQFACRPTANFVVRADRARLRQVLVNLLTNATKFTDRGEVCVSAHRLDDGWGVIEVSDTGCGIPYPELELIFEPFRRGSTTEHVGGVGIGLALSRQLAEAMGGALMVTSEPGVGSTFKVCLALGEPVPVASGADPVAAAG